ncbi:transketolase, N-terminal subunit [Synergistales bacterium]|nr:transketolase, N-terminal subunit [Synergistales bacterium]
MADQATLSLLQERVYEYRKLILQLCHKAKGLHIGGDLSCAETLVTLYQHVMNIDPQKPFWEDRDRFILSKGHCGAGWYLIMAQRGYFDMDEVFETYKGYETRFGAHPCKANCPVLDSSSGSLGHGLPIAAGIALAGKIDGKKFRTYCMIGDAESNEGSIWEAALAAPQFKLGNLVVILDRNRMGLDGFTEEIMAIEPVADKWRAFNWNTVVINGNDLAQVVDAFDNLPPADSEVPTIIVAETTKGKGVSFMENNPLFHHLKIDDAQLEQALNEVEVAYQKQKGGIRE